MAGGSLAGVGGTEGDAAGIPGIVTVSGVNVGSSNAGLTNAGLAAMMDLGLATPQSEKKLGQKKRVSRMGGTSAQHHHLSQQQQQQVHPQSSPAVSRTNSATAEALLTMSADRRSIPMSTTVSTRGSISQPTPTPSASYSSGTQHVIGTSQQPQQQHGFTATPTTATPDSLPSAHGFGYVTVPAVPSIPSIPSTTSKGAIANVATTAAAATDTTSIPTTTTTATNASTISIVAPTHDDMVQLGKFPEPSPAACGKRKMDEIAAAQMLAGVVGSAVTSSTSSSPVSNAAMVAQANKRPNMSAVAMGSASAAMAAAKIQTQINAAMTLEDYAAAVASSEDGRATPPPPPSSDDIFATDGPSVYGMSSSGQLGGLSLQIVNPDTLGITEFEGVGGSKKRLVYGQPSPSTPWDGELEALVWLVFAEAFFCDQC